MVSGNQACLSCIHMPRLYLSADQLAHSGNGSHRQFHPLKQAACRKIAPAHHPCRRLFLISPDIAIDEEGLSFSDVKDFGGQAGLPIISAIGAGIAASGVGFIPGTLIVGGAAALGKALDEGIEYSQGLQKQTGKKIRF